MTTTFNKPCAHVCTETANQAFVNRLIAKATGGAA